MLYDIFFLSLLISLQLKIIDLANQYILRIYIFYKIRYQVFHIFIYLKSSYFNEGP